MLKTTNQVNGWLIDHWWLKMVNRWLEWWSIHINHVYYNHPQIQITLGPFPMKKGDDQAMLWATTSQAKLPALQGTRFGTRSSTKTWVGRVINCENFAAHPTKDSQCIRLGTPLRGGNPPNPTASTILKDLTTSSIPGIVSSQTCGFVDWYQRQLQLHEFWFDLFNLLFHPAWTLNGCWTCSSDVTQCWSICALNNMMDDL